MKLYFVIVLTLTVFASVIWAYTDDHSVIWGQRSMRDRLLEQRAIYKKFKWFGKQEEDFSYQMPKSLYNRITMISVTDQHRNGHGGQAYITDGGPNFPFVKLHFESERFRGYHFVVQIYGE